MMVGGTHHNSEPPHPRPNTAQMALATDIHVLMLVKQQNTTAPCSTLNPSLQMQRPRPHQSLFDVFWIP